MKNMTANNSMAMMMMRLMYMSDAAWSCTSKG